jgi:hypothetical protein
MNYEDEDEDDDEDGSRKEEKECCKGYGQTKSLF